MMMSERRFAVCDFSTNADRFEAYENLCDELEAACELKDAEIAALRAELDAMKSQKPVAWINSAHDMTTLQKYHTGDEPLYARPAPSIPEGYAIVNENSINIMSDSQYIAGMKFGWNCAVSNNESAFQSAIEGRVKERAMIAAQKADR